MKYNIKHKSIIKMGVIEAMKNVCSVCGNEFSSLTCPYCSQSKENQERTIITVTRPVAQQAHEASPEAKTRRERSQARRQSRQAVREAREQTLDEAPSRARLARKQASNILTLFLGGETRRAVHMAVGENGRLAALPLLALSLLVPLCLAIAGSTQEFVAQIREGAVFDSAVLEYLTLFQQWFLQMLLFAAEVVLILAVLVKMQSIVLGTALAKGGVFTLLALSLLPAAFGALPLALIMVFLPKLLPIAAAVVAMMCAILLYMGMEKAAQAIKRTKGVFTHFVMLMLAGAAIFALIFSV